MPSFIFVYSGKNTLVPITQLQLRAEVSFGFFPQKCLWPGVKCTYVGKDSIRPSTEKLLELCELNGDSRGYTVPWKQEFWPSRVGRTHWITVGIPLRFLEDPCLRSGGYSIPRVRVEGWVLKISFHLSYAEQRKLALFRNLSVKLAWINWFTLNSVS